MRVVSLVPSTTETLLAWGIVPVGVTRFCEHPELPQVGGTKNPNISAVVELRPDLVVMCHEENRAVDAEALRNAGLAVHDIAPASVAEVPAALVALADAVGVDGVDLPDMPGSTAAVSPAGAAASPGSEDSPDLPGGRRPEPLGLRAFVPIWRRPLMTINATTYGSSVLEAIGVTNVFGPDGVGEPGDAARYPVVELTEAAARRPDLVLAPSEPYSWKPAHLEELAGVAPVVPVDGQDLFWWGVRTASALSRLHDAIATAIAARLGQG